jgi:hypothetical protein
MREAVDAVRHRGTSGSPLNYAPSAPRAASSMGPAIRCVIGSHERQAFLYFG